MKRRTFLASSMALVALPQHAFAAGFVEYTPGLIQKALDDGKTVFVDYAASWCSTCLRQERVINALRGQNAAYDSAMTFVRVDWDTYGNHSVARARRIPRRSTLILLRGDKEYGRIVAGTSQREIRRLMDKGLQVAQA